MKAVELAVSQRIVGIISPLHLLTIAEIAYMACGVHPEAPKRFGNRLPECTNPTQFSLKPLKRLVQKYRG
jgi:hypothetical protein